MTVFEELDLDTGPGAGGAPFPASSASSASRRESLEALPRGPGGLTATLPKSCRPNTAQPPVSFERCRNEVSASDHQRVRPHRTTEAGLDGIG